MFIMKNKIIRGILLAAPLFITGCTQLELWYEDGTPPPPDQPIYTESIHPQSIFSPEAAIENAVTQLYTEWLILQPTLPYLYTIQTDTSISKFDPASTVIQKLRKDMLIRHSPSQKNYILSVRQSRVETTNKTRSAHWRFSLYPAQDSPRINPVWSSPEYPVKLP